MNASTFPTCILATIRGKNTPSKHQTYTNISSPPAPHGTTQRKTK